MTPSRHKRRLYPRVPHQSQRRAAPGPGGPQKHHGAGRILSRSARGVFRGKAHTLPPKCGTRRPLPQRTQSRCLYHWAVLF